MRDRLKSATAKLSGHPDRLGLQHGSVPGLILRGAAGLNAVFAVAAADDPD
jgi:hypothetical protein